MNLIMQLRLRALLLALAVFMADQFSKFRMMGIQKIDIEVTPFFNLVRVWNYGVSFGMFSEHGEQAEWPKYVLIAMTFAILAALLVWLSRTALARIAFPVALVIGGAAGNLVDRLLHGAVFDFLDLHVAGYHWPAFNVADSAIVVGVLLLCWDSVSHKPNPS